MLNELDKYITVQRQGIVVNDLPSSGQIVLKVTSSNTMLDFPYLQSISVSSIISLCCHWHIYHVLSSSNINKRQKRTRDLSWENPKWGKNPATFLRQISFAKSNHSPSPKSYRQDINLSTRLSHFYCSQLLQQHNTRRVHLLREIVHKIK